MQLAKQSKTTNLVLSGLFIAVGLLLPTVFHTFGMGGKIFLPMHIPILLCGLICGWRYGLIVGIVVPILSSIFTGMPPIFPVAVAMAFELGTYGAVSGMMARKYNPVISLIAAMLAGRVVSGVANAVLFGMAGKPFMFPAFLTGAFVTALPGIMVQIIVIPLIIFALQKSNILTKE